MPTQNIYDLVDTWNAGGTTFTAVKMNVTDTASASGSLLMDLQVGGASRFKVDKNGALTIRSFNGVGTLTLLYNSNTPALNLNAGLCVNTNTANVLFGTNADVVLSRRAAYNLRLGAADAAAPVAQTLSVQSVVAGTSNTAGANLTITGSQGTGTGAGGDIIFQVAPAGATGSSQNALATALTIGPTAITAQNQLLFSVDNTYDIGASTTNRPRSLHVGRDGFFGGDIFSGVGRSINVRSATTAGAALISPSDGVLRIANYLGTGFDRLQFGLSDSTAPAIKRSSTTLQARLADDSAFASVQGKLTTETAYTAGAPTATGYLVLYDSNGTAYRVPAVLN